MKRILFALAAVATIPVVAFAQTDKKMEKCPVPIAGKKVVSCPVTGEKFTPDASTLATKYNGKTYQFCCAGCKAPFDKNPAKFVTAAKTPAKKADAKKVTKKA